MIKQGRIIFPDPVKHKIFMSPELKDLITKLLDCNPTKRLGTENDILDVANHAFFSDVDFDKLQKKEIEAPYKPALEQLTDRENDSEELISIVREENND